MHTQTLFDPTDSFEINITGEQAQALLDADVVQIISKVQGHHAR